MDDLVNDDLERKEFVHQPMNNYMSVVDKINLPNLELDDSDLEGEDEVEPLVFHPVLDSVPDKVCATEVTTEEHSKEHLEKAAANKDEVVKVHVGSHDDCGLTTLAKANLAEMELDNAILSLAPSHSLDVEPDQHTCSLSDSNSSGSSVLGKLEETMAVLRKESEIEDDQLKEKLTDFQSQSKSIKKVEDEPDTIMLDLRLEQITTNPSVLQRYGSSQFNSIDEDHENEDYRRKLKKESELITLNKGKLGYPSKISCDMSEEIADESGICLSSMKTNQESLVSSSNSGYSLSNGSINDDSVDSMLANVNRIMSRGNDLNKVETAKLVKPLKDEAIKSFALKTQHSDDSCDEFVEKYVVFDQFTGKEHCLSPDSSDCLKSSDASVYETPKSTRTDGKEIYIEMKEFPKKKSSAVDLEMNTQIVDWSDVFWSECKDLSVNDSMNVTNEVKEEVSDNLFTNTFFSTSKFSENKEDNLISNQNLKPKKNILSSKKTNTSQTLKLKKDINKPEGIDTKETMLSSNDMTVASDLSQGKTSNKTNNSKLSDGGVTFLNHIADKSDLIKCSNCGGDVAKCNGCLKEGIVASVESIVQDIKKEIKNCHVNGEVSDEKASSETIYRQLKYTNEKKKDNVINDIIGDENGLDKHECLACQVSNPGSETPMKHDESVCVNNNIMNDNNTGRKVVRRVKKNTRSRGTSTNILNLRDANKTNPEKGIENVVDSSANHVDEIDQSNEANKENTNDGTSNKNVVDVVNSTVNVSANNSKNRKKKKSKNKNVADKTIKIVEESVNHVNDVQKKGLENFDCFWMEITEGGKKIVLYDEDVSFEQNYVSVPDTTKQLLLLKVPLESPGVCKAKSNDSIHTFADQNSSDNFIGLVTLFVYLLQGSRRELSILNLDIPFDVVSLQQAHLEGELLLIVGISENKNRNQQKTKRTKLGTNFFHAVSQFLNTNYLDKILWKIWEHTEADLSRIQNSLPFNHIWRQVELKSAERCSIPGSGKLSSFINISPDTNALHRIYNLFPSLLVHIEDKTGSSVPEEYNWFHPVGVKQDYTCITVEDATSISPKHLSELLKRLRKESVEICGLRIGYSVKDHSLYTPTLSICINEFNAATAGEGKLLLSDCDELKELAISFNTQDNISVIMNGSPWLNYTINPQRSHRQVVQWFGPHYKDVTELKNTLTELKSNGKVSANKNDKKKWALGSCHCQLSLLNTYMSSAVLFISALVPSAFISFVISIALKKGLQLKMVYKTCCSVSQLGFPEDKGDFFFYTDSDKRKGLVANRCMVSCILLLFSGKSAALRLLGLICKLTEILNNPLTGETLAPWMVDNMIKFNPSHNTNNYGCKLNSVPKEYFGVLHFNDHIKDLLSTSFKPPKLHIVEDLYSILSRVQISFSRPEINLMALLLYGDEILQDVPTILRTVFSDCAFSCLNSWRESVRSRPFAIKYQPAIEFLGAKYINSISKLQAGNLILREYCETEIDKLYGKKAVLIMLKAVDKRTFNQIDEKISKYILSSKLDLSSSNYILHTDTEYVFRLMFHFFEPIELHGDQLKDESQIPPFCLPDHHILFTVLDNLLDTRIHNQVIVKKKLPDKDWKSILPYTDIPTTSCVYQFSPSSLSFPLQMLLRCEKSYAGVSFEYLPHNIQTISKALARICRMGFQLAALKFPSYDPNNGSCHVRAVFLREDAVFVLNKMVPELETNYPKLKFTFTDVVHGVNSFVHNEFKGCSDGGGIFHCNYFALINGLYFEKDECFEKRKNQEVEWNPENCNFENGMWHVKKENTPLSITGSLVASADEVSVIILSEPLISGRYLGKRLPENCIFPEVLHFIESCSYRMIAGKTTMVSKGAAKEIIDVYDVGCKKKSRMVQLLSQEGGPFIVIALVGSCILSNFWLTMERKLDDEDALNVLKHHCLVPSTKKQVETLLVSLFDRVVLNTKVEIKTKLS